VGRRNADLGVLQLAHALSRPPGLGRRRPAWFKRWKVHLVDGTYELFRHYYAVPSARDRDGREVGAVRGVLRSVLG